MGESGEGEVAESGPIHVLFAGGERLWREAVRAAFEQEADLEIVGEAEDSALAAAEAEHAHPDVTLLDLALLNGEGLDALALLKERAPESRILVLADDSDEDFLIQALEGGATGYLTKQCGLSELLDAVRTVSRGEMRLPSELVSSLLDEMLDRRRAHKEALLRIYQLTRRERQVLALLVEDPDTRAIAEALVISPETARTHVQHVLSKLGVRSKPEAIAFLLKNDIDEGLIEAATNRRDGWPRRTPRPVTASKSVGEKYGVG
jgi:DNA-binding NarL/FixJ family response regulator